MSIRLKDNIKPISYIKSNAAAMLNYVNEQKNPMIITQNGEAKAVIMDIDSYQSMQDAFAMLNIIRLAEDDIAHGRVYSLEEVSKELDKEIEEIRKEKEREKNARKKIR